MCHRVFGHSVYIYEYEKVISRSFSQVTQIHISSRLVNLNRDKEKRSSKLSETLLHSVEKNKAPNFHIDFEGGIISEIFITKHFLDFLHGLV